ncbi:Ferredoxin reductase [Pseudonocardia sp. Ae168_Ps1]|uniref:NAD(P)/FAD-dependent oxidoreductase n=1 Tax=unclassified Pseudonocardia TaxID=2619320 RepID=UPI0009636E14|nr:MULTISPECIES: FAD-dependent oxidoreductase [unclassified Pseudonocardia]OLL73460.1 Ferredoxin reductase [Pseudonocardia sp. Ae150A_Ps1]OLL79436.1 Ferredoxin reductase [Pseudonocardia sp. Ae168_Ps1]OLL86429.1 Ferredoxin reductase [Pseudonocardia sp. Ae263_Ps1]OLL93530.1 Ferredoxin reductase [Pseudonocardia sp. Ae356_Ps1]
MDRIVVGAGLAGHRAATGLRAAGYAGRLTMVGDEVHRPYDRPPLSKQVLAGAVDTERLFFPVDDLDVDWALGSSATSLDPSTRTVGLADGSELGYDGLVIATGRRARPWPGPVPGGVHVLRSLDDAAAVRRAAETCGRAVIIGAGFVGCEVAATLRGHDVPVTVVDVAERPMAVLGPDAGRIATDLHLADGVDFRLGSGVADIEGDPVVTGVRLSDGELLPADLVLVATGSLPNSEWLTDSGLALSAGSVLCDERCLALGEDGVVRSDVVVAGDVAARPQPYGEPACIEHWSNARDTGDAARNLLATPDAPAVPVAGVPSVWSDQYDTKIKTAGHLRAATEFVVVEEDPDRPALVVEARRDGIVVGAVVFNRNRTIIGYQRSLAAPPAAA